MRGGGGAGIEPVTMTTSFHASSFFLILFFTNKLFCEVIAIVTHVVSVVSSVPLMSLSLILC